MAKGKLVLLRHGQTTYNEKQLMCGQHDAPLTQLGEDQARTAGASLGDFAFDKVYASSLSRAFNTAALALGTSGANGHLKRKDGGWDIEKRDDIREMDAGDFSGRSLSDPEILAFPRKADARLPGGESENEFLDRVRAFFDGEVMPRLKRGETVLVVSHAGVMHALDLVMGIEEPGPQGIWGTKKRLPNAAAFVAEYDDGKLISCNPVVPACGGPRP